MSVDAYEQVPYPSQPHQQAMPSKMSVIAGLFGLDPTPPERARVLEIGCAGGGNLIPRAAEHPKASFLGIDPVLKHVREGQQVLFALGLDNMTIERRGLEDLSPEDGPFDYIIVHGVFSWIEPDLRHVLLERCAGLLSRHGVAYISYNTLPGWHMRRMVRDAMRFHVEAIEEPGRRVEQARAILGFLADTVPADRNPWGAFLAQEQRLLEQKGDFYLFHDHLSSRNDPIYFRDFARLTQDAGLAYLGEAELCDMMTLDLPERVRSVLDGLSDELVRAQQYLDFVLNRAFRRSLLVRADAPIERTLEWTSLRDLFVSSDLRSDQASLDLTQGVPLTFRAGPRELQSDHRAIKAGWTVFQEHHPEPLSFASWVELSGQRLAAAGVEPIDDLESTLGPALLQAFARDLAELWPHPIRLGGDSADRPKAFSVALLQARVGCPWGVSNRRHEVVRLDPIDRALLALCDGTRDREELLTGLEREVERGGLVLRLHDGQAATANEARDVLRRELPTRLAWLDRHALLRPVEVL